MKWVLGTGRCGTQSAARQFNLLHEPKPWVAEEAWQRYHRQGDAGKLTETIWKNLDTRMMDAFDQGKEGIADCTMWSCVPDIMAVDKDPEIIWLVRDPVGFCSSAKRKGVWARVREDGRSAMFPHWPQPPECAGGRVEKLLYQWLTLNTQIYRDLLGYHVPVKCILTSELEQHVGKAGKTPHTDLNLWEATLATAFTHKLDSMLYLAKDMGWR